MNLMKYNITTHAYIHNKYTYSVNMYLQHSMAITDF